MYVFEDMIMLITRMQNTKEMIDDIADFFCVFISSMASIEITSAVLQQSNFSRRKYTCLALDQFAERITATLT